MFLYQLMMLSTGEVLVDELLIADTSENDLSADDIIYKTLVESDFTAGDIEGDISTEFNDSNYHMRTKTLPEISGLELRGTPSDTVMPMRLTGTTIIFNVRRDGTDPDLSSLANGSEITLSNTENGNDGVYIVDSVSSLTVTIASKPSL